MRTYILVGCLIVVSLIFAFTNKGNTTEPSENQWIISIHYLTLQDGVDKQDARKYLETEWLKMFRETPGMNAMLGKPDRGGAKGDFVIVYTFDSKWTRDYYYPIEGQFGEPIKKVIEKYKIIYEKIFETYFVGEEYSYDDYLLFAESK